MSRSLTPNSSLDSLRREAKRWLKAIAAGDAEAVARFRAVFPDHALPDHALPDHAGAPKLREVQQALAREHGYASWAAMKQEIEDRARSHAERVELFLEKGVHRYGTDPRTRKWGSYERDGDYRGAIAARLLARHPEIAREDIHTAVLAHDVEAVRGFLAKDPGLANQQHAFDDWRPLARLAYARLPIPAVADALTIAGMLLDAGADPRLAAGGDLRNFTVMTGAIGEGEGGQSPHPQAEAFVRLLIARGADPLDGQALYDTSLGEDDVFWMQLMWEACEKRGDDMNVRWHTAIPDTLGPPLEYLLGNAVNNQHVRRISWLLEHGADPNAANFYSKLPVVRHAVMAGRQDIVDLLVRHGAERPELTDGERFIAAAAQGDTEAVRRLAEAHPDFLQSPHAMAAAISSRRIDVVEALLALGMSPDVGDRKNFRALHHAAQAGAVDIARVLVDRGAEIDAIEQTYKSTALGHAVYGRRADTIALLAPLSRDVASLCWGACLDRLRDLLSEDGSLASKPGRWGEPPLFCLPDEDERAGEVVELLLSFGADVQARNAEGLTPGEAARKRGLMDAAALLEP